MKRFSKSLKVLLLAVPMLACSLTGQAGSYNIEFGTPYATSPSKGQMINANGAVMWTYVINGTVNDLKYNADKHFLSFSIPAGGVTENSLTLTSSQRYSGKLSDISIPCEEISGLVITAYVGQTKLCNLEYNGKGYFPVNLSSRGLLYERISLKFKVASGANGVIVSGLSKVNLYVQDQIFPQYIGASVTFDSSLFGVDLSNRTYNGILLTLDSSNGDGCDEDEDGNYVLYTGSTLTDEAVANLNDKVKNHETNYWPGDEGYAEAFKGGITVMAARGKGTFQLEAKTESNYAYHVKIGNADPVELMSTDRETLSVPYNVDYDTFIYIYMVEKSPSSSRSGTRIGKRGTAHGIVYTVKCSTAPIEKTDLSVYVDRIMNRDDFIFPNADRNGDNKINVADIVDVLNIE